MNSQQQGKFCLEDAFVRNNPEIVAKAFSDMQFVAVRAESMFCYEKIEYFGISSKFQEIEKGMMVPEYLVDIIMKQVKPVMEVNPFKEEYSHVEVIKL